MTRWATRSAKIVGLVFAAFVVIVIVACAGVYFYVQANGLKQLTERGSAALGRPIKIESLDIDWGRTTHVRITNTIVDNVKWATAEHFLEAKAIDFDIRLWPILRGNFHLPKLIVDQPKLFLEKGAHGETNWSFGAQPAVTAAGDIAAPEERNEAPAIDYMDIKDGQLQYKDAAKKLKLDGKLAFGTGEASGSDTIAFQGQGELEGRNLKVEFNGGSFTMLKESKQPYPLKLSIRYGATAIDVEGTCEGSYRSARN